MKSSELDHKIERYSAQAAHDEALAKVLMASAAEKREMVDTIRQMKEELEELKANQQVHNTYNIGHDFIQEQNINVKPLRPYEQDN